MAKNNSLLKELILQDLPVQEVLERTGYSRIAYFRAKKKLGKTKTLVTLEPAVEQKIIDERLNCKTPIKILSLKYNVPVRSLNNILYEKNKTLLNLEDRGKNRSAGWLLSKDFKSHDEWLASEAIERNGTYLGPYLGYKEKTNWKCQLGHLFLMTPNHVVSQNQWCPKCYNSISKGHQEVIDYIETLLSRPLIDGLEINNRAVILNPDSNKYLELDIYLKNYNFGFEYNGLYTHSIRYEGIKSTGIELKEHLRKFKACTKAGVNLLAIYEDEWKGKQDLIKAMIRWRLNKFVGTRVYPRHCKLIKLDKNAQFKDFFDTNHIDGHVNALFAVGLMYNGKLIMCASVRKNFNKEFEIARLATDYNFAVPGGAGKLISYIKKLENSPLVSYSNNRLSSGNVYKQLGFQFLNESPSSYWYTDGRSVRLWRWKCRRINTPEILTQFPTEKAQALGGIFSKVYLDSNRPLYKIEDYGHQKWLL